MWRRRSRNITAWKGDVRTIPLVVEVQKPRITDDVGALGITTRIARGVSNFSGSDAARAHNIAVAAGYLDDTVIAPGEVFSFLDSIGEISTARGYKDGYVILAEQTVPGVGGGVCQVATTMFRAAMYSGLPIEERNPHAYLVGYYTQGGYPVGLDAAVFEPGVDLKFRNETDKYMLIKTSIDSGNLYISIYGPDLGYKVDIGDPVIKNNTKPPEDEYRSRSDAAARHEEAGGVRQERRGRGDYAHRPRRGRQCRSAGDLQYALSGVAEQVPPGQRRHAAEGDQGDDRAEYAGRCDESAHAADKARAVSGCRAGDLADKTAADTGRQSDDAEPDQEAVSDHDDRIDQTPLSSAAAFALCGKNRRTRVRNRYAVW